MRTLLAQDLGLIDTTGRRLALTVRDFVAQYRQRQTWRYLSLVLVVLVASDPVSLAHVLPFHAYMLAWVLGIGCYFGSQILLMLGVAALRRRLPRSRIYWPLISVLALGPTLILLERGLEFSLGIELRTLLLGKMLYLLVTVVMFEGIFMRFVYTPCPGAAHPGEPAPEPPSREASAPQAESADEALAARLLLIGAQPVPLAELVYLEARQHHVCAQLSGGTLTLRTRLSDVVAQTTPEEGVQPHRSWWVARQAIEGLAQQDGKPVLRLRGGTTVPVARGRLPEVERWLAAHVT